MANVDTEVTQIIVNRLTKTQLENAGTLPADELYCVDPEFTGDKILTTSSDGSEIIETSLSADNLVTDVQVNGTTITSSGVANIPVASNSNFGVIKVTPASYGIGITTSTGDLYINHPTEAQIISKTNPNFAVTLDRLNIAIREGLGNNDLTWTDTYKSNARNTIGATQAVFVDWSD